MWPLSRYMTCPEMATAAKGVAMFADFPSALIPAWILGAPLVLAIVERMRMPRPRS